MLSLLLGIIYLSFISLGLPDSLLGAAWPVIHAEIGAPLSASGFVFMIIAVGTIVSSLLSDRLTRRLGAGKVTSGHFDLHTPLAVVRRDGSIAPMMAGPTVAPTPHMQCSQLMCRLA